MLPIFHPTTTILVDDVQSYLESLRQASPAEMPILPFLSPEKAIQHIRKENEITRAKFGEFLQISTDTDRVVVGNRVTQDQIMRLSISNLNRKIELPERFDEISVIICDYQMPSMKGTDFFEQLGDIPQKRILLTGEADETVAVKAFNDGIIDKFLTKGRPGIIQELFGHMRRYQRDYFRHQYSFIKSAFGHGESLFSMPQFDKLVKEISEEQDFVEHYYVNFPDGALLIDDDGYRRKRLVALRDSDYEGIIELLGTTRDADPEFIRAMRDRSMVPNESYGRGAFGDFEFWREMCLPATKFEHPSGNLYYALWDVRDEIDLDNARFFTDRLVRGK